ncbi:MAG: hypothetical protein HZA66_00860 [Rhodopseudomonas palustris]|uniref:Uncharacterized protein n=1 Tax=Rhodopseudomonas palustris TaxID=1076 RepID=A0A933RTF9_RHOPL|nr:hypothetical protein [Rhodopseudomonas palustris]
MPEVDGETNQTGGLSAPDETTAALARAFDSAWERFIGVEGSRADTDANRKRLAAKIVALSRAGQIDEDTIAQSALIHLCVLAEAARLGNQPHEAADPGSDPQKAPHAQAFNPQTVAAMSAALEQCVETLPLQTPSSALQFLSARILEAASRGEQDPERLSQHALEALRNR